MSEYKPSIAEKDAYGTLLAASNFGGAILGAALYGIQLFMVIASVSAFLRRSKEARRGHIRYIIFSCVILGTFSIDLAFDIWRTFRILFAGGPTARSYVSVYVKDWQRSRAPIIAGDAFLAITVAVGDILMLWRCLILWNHKRWIVLLPSFTCLGAIVCHIIYLVPEREGILPHDAAKAAIASSSLSVAMNIMVTSLILLRLMMTWLQTSKAFPDRKTPRMYTDAAGIIVESAAPLAVFGICSITINAIDNLQSLQGLLRQGRITALNEVFGWLYYSFCALSPQMIIYRVATGRSWKDAAESIEGGVNISQPIQFARTVKRGSSSGSSSADV
ncbi:hypothetical protein BKA70DRAFT_1432703 [Coprinopsis sp. MPI-PUGE-AT-0042]|nr:hypothetical protein BKA70DRAFT_1432703 [Coprinopsis sp. MPI-PUGE-AT-0042]